MDEEHSGIVDLDVLLHEMRRREEARACSCARSKPRSRLTALAAPALVVALVSLGANAFAFVHGRAPATTPPTPPTPPAAIARTPPWVGAVRFAAPRAPVPVVPERAPFVAPTAASRRAVAHGNGARRGPAASAPVVTPGAELVGPSPPKAPAAAPDLDSAMRAAAGAPALEARKNEDDRAPGARQLRPAQGAIVAALRPAQERARACLEADDAPRVVSVTFVAAGTVAVLEPPPSDTKSACIDAALRRASVEPFAEASFRARVTVRPR